MYSRLMRYLSPYGVRSDVLAGMTTVLALIPDCLAFAFIAGVNPIVSIYSTICILFLTSVFGGRPGMVSSSAGSMAVLMTAIVADHGLGYLFAATLLTGVLQLAMGLFKLGKLMKFVPPAVVTGFVNSLAILIFVSQLRYFDGQSWLMYAMVAGTLAIIYILPRLTRIVPSPLAAVVLMTLAAAFLPYHGQAVGDLGAIVPTVPSFGLPSISFSWDTLWIILPTAISLAIVGYAETLLTQTMLDEETGTKTSKNRELVGQGIANSVSGLFGGMAGCALVAESVINVKVGGRGRLSTIVAGVVLLVLIVLLGDVVAAIPLAALVGVMMMVCFEIFSWKSVFQLKKLPALDTVVMLATVAIVVPTHDLAKGVLAGVFLHATARAWLSRKGRRSAKSGQAA